MRRSDSRHRVIHRSRARLALGIALGLTVLVLVHDAIREHAPKSWLDDPLWYSPWLKGIGGAASLVIVALSVFIARDQFATNVTPRLRYSCGPSEKPSFPLAPSPRGYWSVEVSNVGRGMAIIDKVTYDVTIDEPAVSRDDASFADMFAVLELLGAGDDDYGLDNWSKDTAFREGTDRTLWEFRYDVATRLRRLDARIRYRSSLGDVYELRVSAVPQTGWPREAV